MISDMRIQFLPVRGLMALGLTMLAFWSMAQDLKKEDLATKQSQEISKGVKQINSQLVRLRQFSMQADQMQKGQSQVIQQKIDGIILSHSSLFEQILGLQVDNQQQIERLQLTTQRMSLTLVVITGLAVLILFLFLFNYPRIKSMPSVTEPPPDLTPSTETMPPKPFASIDQATGLRAMFGDTPLTTTSKDTLTQESPLSENSSPLQPGTQNSPPEPVQAAIKPSQTARTTSWSVLVASDLNSTEQALSEAREGFMRPVQIP